MRAGLCGRLLRADAFEERLQEAPLGIAREQEAEQSERHLHEHCFGRRDKHFGAGRRGEDVEPRVDEEQGRGGRGRCRKPGRAVPGGEGDRKQKERSRR